MQTLTFTLKSWSGFRLDFQDVAMCWNYKQINSGV